MAFKQSYAYYPDSHVTKFIHNIGLLRKKKSYTLDEYMIISEAMSKLFSNQYFDLPFMRYHQQKCNDKVGCKCEIKKCYFNSKESYLF